MSVTVPTDYAFKNAIEVVAKYIGFTVSVSEDASVSAPVLKAGDAEVFGFVAIANHMARTTVVKKTPVSKALLADGNAELSAQIEQFTAIADSIFSGSQKADMKVVIGQVQAHIKTRTFLVGTAVTMADILLAVALYPTALAFGEHEKKSDFADVVRWLLYINAVLGAPFEEIKVQKGAFTPKAAPAKGAAQKAAPKAAQQQQQKQGKKEKKAKKPAAPKPEAPKVDAFAMIDIRVAQIVKVWPHPDADSLYCEEIDIGDGVIKKVITGVRKFVPLEEMQGRRVVVFTNIKPGKIRGMPSESMVFAGSNSDHTIVELLTPPADAPVGSRVVCGDFIPDPSVKPPTDNKGKWWKEVAAEGNLTINADHLACYKGIPLTVPGFGNLTVATLSNCEFH